MSSSTSGPSSIAPKRNRFYALKARGVEESCPDVVMSMLQVFSINVYDFVDSSATLSFVTYLVSRKFDVLPYFLIESILVCTPIGDSVVAKRVHRIGHVMHPNRVILDDLVELYMF